MIKSFCTLFLSASSLAWSMDADAENIHPNIFTNQSEMSFHKEQVGAALENNKVSIEDTRTREEIERRIDFLEGQLAGYRSFNEEYYKVIQQLKDLNFFDKDFPQNNPEVLKILESVFTNNYGQGDSWGPVIFELYRRPQSFIKRFIQIREDVINRDSEHNQEIRKILTELNNELYAANFMIVYYLNNKS